MLDFFIITPITRRTYYLAKREIPSWININLVIEFEINMKENAFDKQQQIPRPNSITKSQSGVVHSVLNPRLWDRKDVDSIEKLWNERDSFRVHSFEKCTLRVAEPRKTL